MVHSNRVLAVAHSKIHTHMRHFSGSQRLKPWWFPSTLSYDWKKQETATVAVHFGIRFAFAFRCPLDCPDW
jgi:hypothetical protein